MGFLDSVLKAIEDGGIEKTLNRALDSLENGLDKMTDSAEKLADAPDKLVERAETIKEQANKAIDIVAYKPKQ